MVFVSPIFAILDFSDRLFKAGQGQKCSRRVATPEIGALFNRRYATKRGNHLIPALKRRAKLIPTLRIEDLIRASISLSPYRPLGTKKRSQSNWFLFSSIS